jgi:tetratricopeptide (TPR) repeat protein
MPILSAENSFKKGLAAFIDDNFIEARVYFREAIDIERQRRVKRPQMRYLSYYGFCLAKTNRPLREAIHACRTAALSDGRDPDLFLILGRVYLMARRTSEALNAFERGLRVGPSHRGLRREYERVTKRLGLAVDRRRPNTRGGLLARVRSALSPRSPRAAVSIR